ncbi:MAG: disulfide bond formation protein DsbA [Parcubacteria group bacterium]|nr:disulfide bond formation protein DsbA [Parcubacteria group bacterium]
MNNGSTFMEKYLTPIAILLAAVIIAFALFYGHGASKNATDGTGAGAAAAVDVKNIKTDGDPYIGQANAPQTMVLFYDYQCPFCKQFELGVTPKLVEQYVKTGKLKIVFKDFQFLGNDSIDAAVFGRAVWESQPDKFYEWYVAMFNAQDDEGDQGFGDLASIEKLAGTIKGLDVAKADALVKSKRPAYESAITADRAEGAALGINGTPTIVVGKQVLTGLSSDQYYTSIVAALEGK